MNHLGIGLLELVVIAVAALVLLGPQRLPEVLRTLGRFYVQLRRTSTDIRGAFDQVVREAEEELHLEQIKKLRELASTESPPTLPPQKSPPEPTPQGRDHQAIDAWSSAPAVEEIVVSDTASQKEKPPTP